MHKAGLHVSVDHTNNFDKMRRVGIVTKRSIVRSSLPSTNSIKSLAGKPSGLTEQNIVIHQRMTRKGTQYDLVELCNTVTRHEESLQQARQALLKSKTKPFEAPLNFLDTTALSEKSSRNTNQSLAKAKLL